MITASQPPTQRVDDLEAKLVRCLQISPRARFKTLGEVLGTSEQTVARRYRKLVAAGAIRVRGYVPFDVRQQDAWVVRLRCGVPAGDEVADELVARREARWVALCSGGTEVVSVLLSPHLGLEHATEPTPTVVGHALVLHTFTPQPHGAWAGLQDLLTDEQEARVRETSVTVTEIPATDDFDEHDAVIIDALTGDGRTSVAALAELSGLSEGRASRRLETLLGSGLVGVRVDLSPRAFGADSLAVLWLDVAPRHLDQVGRALAGERQVINVIALSGTWNLGVLMACTDAAALYEFVVRTVGAHDAVRATEVSPVVRRVSAAS
jgi:DNA-binding Lrp family transcriptional regulator